MKGKFENEILVCETMILQLRKCLVIFYQGKCFEEYRATLKDIQILKKDLRRLQVANKAIVGAKKGVAKNAVK